MKKVLLTCLLAASIGSFPVIALADDSAPASASDTNAKPVASATIIKTEKAPPADTDTGKWMPRHQEAKAFWDNFNLMVYPGGAGAGGDGGGN